ncbi:MAG: hypothetical protein Q8P18_31415 [Pseudomonadota bacterium]|nr:hypothetical protein [Pseudomonadota bacterium]
MRPSPLLALPLLALALAACADPPPPEVHKLIDIYHPVVQLNTGSVPGGVAEVIQLFVHPKLVGMCHPIPTLTATLDGKPMTQLHGRVGGALPYDRDCSVFEFTLDAAQIVPGPTNELVVSDGETTYHVGIADLYAPRVATASPTDVKPGDTVTLAWSPATDKVAAKGAVTLELEAGDKRAVIKRADLVFAPGSIAFVVPPGLTGDVTVTVFGTAFIQPAVTKCEGPTICGVARDYDVPPVTIHVTP